MAELIEFGGNWRIYGKDDDTASQVLGAELFMGGDGHGTTSREVKVELTNDGSPQEVTMEVSRAEPPLKGVGTLFLDDPVSPDAMTGRLDIDNDGAKSSMDVRIVSDDDGLTEFDWLVTGLDDLPYHR